MGKLTEMYHYFNTKEIAPEWRYSHIDISDPRVKASRKKHRELLKLDSEKPE